MPSGGQQFTSCSMDDFLFGFISKIIFCGHNQELKKPIFFGSTSLANQIPLKMIDLAWFFLEEVYVQ